MKMRGRKEAKVIISTLGMTAILPLTVYASSNYAENAGRWVLEQAFWVILVMGIVTASLAIVKRAYVAGCITGIAVGVVCFFCKNPDKLSSIGEQLAQTFLK